jgi:mxaJ protein
MSSVCRIVCAAVAVTAVAVTAVALTAIAPPAIVRADGPAPLRVCADPNNLPFSNAQGGGFENRVAELVARELGRPLTYFWLPQRRAFVRNSIAARRCDLVMGVPARYERLRTTRPYYRSSYAFVSKADRALDLRGLDDPRLRTLRLGIQLTGGYDNPPPAEALAARRIVDNVRGYMVYGDYSTPEPQREIVDAVAAGAIDVGIVWGPVAGYFARREPVPMSVVPVAPSSGRADPPFAFDIAMGVRPGDEVLRRALDRVIARRRSEIRRILSGFGVPLL